MLISSWKASDKAVPNEKKREIGEEAAGQQIENRRKISGKFGKNTVSAEEFCGTPVDTPRKDHVTDSSVGKFSVTKAAGLKLCGTSKKRSAIEAGFEEKADVKKARRVPVGLLNFHRACFANAVTRCLQGTASINGYYRTQARGVLARVRTCVVTKETFGARAAILRRSTPRSAWLEKPSVSELRRSHFRQLCNSMLTATESSISPFIFQQAIGSQPTNEEEIKTMAPPIQSPGRLVKAKAIASALCVTSVRVAATIAGPNSMYGYSWRVG